MSNWASPTIVDDASAAFGGDMAELLPPLASIPEEFRFHSRTKWHKAQAQWFFSGIKRDAFTPKAGVDPVAALRHLKAIQSSYAPKHEHKEAAVAWLMSLWFDDVALAEGWAK